MQTSASDPADITPAYYGVYYDASVHTSPGPYYLYGLVSGADGTGATVTSPNANTYGLLYVPGDNQYEYVGTGYASASALNAAYANGAYTFNGFPGVANGTSYNLTGDAYPTPLKITQVNGGATSWNNGNLVLSAGQDNVLTVANIAANFATSGVENISVSGNDNSAPDIFLFGPGGASPATTFDIPADSLTAGETYILNILYASFVDGGTGDTAISGVGYQTHTFLTIEAVDSVPEPPVFWLLLAACLPLGALRVVAPRALTLPSFRL